MSLKGARPDEIHVLHATGYGRVPLEPQTRLTVSAGVATHSCCVLAERQAHHLSLLISLTNWYDQKPLIGAVGTRQMNDVCAVPPAAGETL